MGTVKDVCWSSKYRKQLQAKLQKKDANIEFAENSRQTVKTAKNPIKPAIKLQSKKESCRDITKRLVDSLQLYNSKGTILKDSQISQISLCLKPCCKPVEDFSKHPDQCCPADDCPQTQAEKKDKCKMCRRKKSPCPGDCSQKKDQEPPCPDEPKEQCCSKEKDDKTEFKKPKCCYLPEFICCDEPRPKRKKVKGRRTKANSSICIINESARANCCACCCLLAEYFKEVLRLFCIKNDTRVSEIFCELIEVAGCICNDCLNFLKKLITCVCALQGKCC